MVVLVAALAFFAGQGLERADKWASIGSFVLIFVAEIPLLLVSITKLFKAWHAGKEGTSSPPRHRKDPERPRLIRKVVGAMSGSWRARRRLSAGGVFVAVLLTASLSTDALAAVPLPDAPPCPHPVQLNVLTSTEKARVLRDLAVRFEDWSRGTSDEGCRRVDVQVSIAPSADVAIAALSHGWSDEHLRDVAPEPHVWLPDANSDYEQVRSAIGLSGATDVELQHKGSIALSPLVLAMPPEMGARLGWPDQTFRWRDLLALAEGAAGEVGPNRTRGPLIGRTNPRSSSAGMAATVALYRSALGQPKLDSWTLSTLSAPRLLNEVEKWIPVGSDDTGKLLCPLRPEQTERAGTTAALVSEKTVRDFNLGHALGDTCAPDLPEVSLDFRYAEEGTPFLDHPFISIRWTDRPVNERRQRIVDEFFQYLTSAQAQDVLKGDGYRDRSGRIGYIVGARPSRPVELAGALGASLDADAVLEAWESARKPARVLVAVDVSASMAEPFGDVGGNRIRAADDAISQSLRLIGARDQVGLWAFARQLDGQADHRVLVELGDGEASGNQVRAELDRLQPASTGPALYDTVHAAVDHLRTNRPGSESADATSDAVVVVADGTNSEPGRFSPADVAELITDGGRGQVRVFVIAFAEDVCSSFELPQITREAGGECYEVSSAGDIRRALDGVASGLWGGGR